MISLLRFYLNGQDFAVFLDSIKEITHVYPVTPVPGTPPLVSGVCNHRGDILSVLSLSSVFGLPHINIGKDSRIIVGDIEGRNFGILTDSIEKIVNVNKKDIKTVTAGLMDSGEEVLYGVISEEKDVIPVVDLKKLIFHKDIVDYWNF